MSLAPSSVGRRARCTFAGRGPEPVSWHGPARPRPQRRYNENASATFAFDRARRPSARHDLRKRWWGGGRRMVVIHKYVWVCAFRPGRAEHNGHVRAHLAELRLPRAHYWRQPGLAELTARTETRPTTWLTTRRLLGPGLAPLPALSRKRRRCSSAACASRTAP